MLPGGIVSGARRREGRPALSPTLLSLARGIKPRCRPLTATLPTRTPPGDIVRSQVLSSRAPRVLLADAAGLRPLVPSLPHVPEPLRRCDSAFVPRSRDTRRREQLTPQRLRARDTRMMSLRPPASRRPSATCGCRGPCPAEPCARWDRRREHDGTGRLVSHFERVTFSSARLSIARATETAALPEDSVL